MVEEFDPPILVVIVKIGKKEPKIKTPKIDRGSFNQKP